MPKSLNLAGYPVYITTNTLNRAPLFADSGNADIVIRALYYCRKAGWIHLLAFVVMPDHLHFIAVLLGEKTLSQLLHSIKSYSSKQINERLRKEGGNWQAGKWEFTIGSREVLLQKVAYIHNNPVRRGLLERPEDYPFSSANPKFETDLGLYL